MGRPNTKTAIIDSAEAMLIWDTELNNQNNLDPQLLGCGSHLYADFICPICSDKWHGVIRDAIKQGKCPQCRKQENINAKREKKVEEGASLISTHPQIAAEWVYEDNASLHLTPHTVKAGSNHLVTWQCSKCGNKYPATIVNRTKNKSACPYCAGQKVMQGYNDLASLYPTLLLEWDYEKNDEIGLFPTNVTRGTKTIAHWICPLGHKYQRMIRDRTLGKGCQQCAKESQTSLPEQILFFYIKQHFAETQNRYLVDDRYEIDIYIPEKKIGIEYDGVYYHERKKRKPKHDKEEVFAKRGISLFRVIEIDDGDFHVEGNNIYTPYNGTYSYLIPVIDTIFKLIGVHEYDIDIKRDAITVYEQFISMKKENSVASDAVLLNEWNYEKNGKISPSMITYNSTKYVYWICDEGHSYMASPKERHSGKKCPYCEGREFLRGYNDFRTYAEVNASSLLKEWDLALNTISPEDVYYRSDTVIHWICSTCNRRFQAILKDRINGQKCKYCAHKYVDETNSFAMLHPELLSEWDFSRNLINPNCIAEQSNKNAYWICSKCGNHYSAQIKNRVKGAGCRKCGVQKSILGSNETRVKNRGSLSTNRPLLLNDWDYHKNEAINLNPDTLTAGSGLSAYWRCCHCSHEWMDTINARSHGKKCPNCGYTPYPKPKKDYDRQAAAPKIWLSSNKSIVAKRGSLAQHKPLLAAEWHQEKNQHLLFSPETITCGCKYSVWWHCSQCDHEWEDSIQARNYGKKCPKCGYTPYPRNRTK